MQSLHKLLRLLTACSALLLAACGGNPTYDCGNVTVSTVAGSGVASYADGVGTLASFNDPAGLATDGTNLYVAESDNHRVRKIVLATGEVSTLAGSGVAGYADGVGTAASFNIPGGLATDGTNLYVADSWNNRVRRIVLATGEVSTLAGSGVAGYADGVGTAASFNGPRGLAIDGTNLYVADAWNHRVRRIVLATGEVSTLAGSGVLGYVDGPGAAARFTLPSGLAVDGPYLYVADNQNHQVRRIVLATGEVSTLAGRGSPESDGESIDGTGTAAIFNGPYGLATDGTNLYVTELSGDRVRKIVIATAVVTTLAGRSKGYADGPGKDARFEDPLGIVVHGTSQDGTNMYVADSSNNRIRKLNYLPGACPAPQTYAVGGAVTGLATGETLVLRNNGGDDKAVSENGVFAFSAAVGSGKAYSVSVLTQPAGQSCTVSNGSGTATANVDTVQVQCVSNAHTIGGTVIGLSGTVVLQNNGGGDLSVSADGSFAFAAPVASGSTYAVTVLTQPAGQTCTVSNGSGTATADVVNVSVSCAANTYEIGGIVNGLNAVGLELENNAGDAIQVFPDGFSMSMLFTFPTRIPQGGTYSVTVRAQPAGQTCTVTAGGSGTATANVSDVTVDCL